MRTATSSALAFAIVVAICSPVRAQTAEAEALFREGKKLLKKGQIAEACDKFEASERLEQGIGTELNLADCREKNGQTASAWAMFVKAAATAKHADDEERAAEAKRRAKVLEKQLVYLTINVSPDAALDDLVIKRNKEPIDRALWNQAVPIDPDEYTISAEAPAHKTWSRIVTVKATNKVVEVPVLPEGEKKPAKHEPDVEGKPGKPIEIEKQPPPPPAGPPRRYKTAFITLGVAGLGLVVVGTGFALYARDLENQADAACPHPVCGDPGTVDINHSARQYALFADIGWGVGGAALVGAALLWWRGAPASDDKISIVPIVDRDRAALVLGGRF